MHLRIVHQELLRLPLARLPDIDFYFESQASGTVCGPATHDWSSLRSRAVRLPRCRCRPGIELALDPNLEQAFAAVRELFLNHRVVLIGYPDVS